MDTPWDDRALIDSFTAEFNDLVAFATASACPSGFGYLNGDGTVDLDRPVELWITSRMTHVFSLATMLGIEQAHDYATHGVRALSLAMRDHEYGGWFSAVSHDVNDAGHAEYVGDGRKEAYAHAFVLLAASSATQAGIPGGLDLLALAANDQDQHWWQPQYGRGRESWDRSFTTSEAYRGLNSNMHTVEAYLAAFYATGERLWLDRARAILRWAADLAVQWDGRLPEHFTQTWEVQPSFNSDKPSDPFRPYGATPGHGFEWARLMLHLRGALRDLDDEIPNWTLDVPALLFERAAADGWDEVHGGFVYTTDFSGTPVVPTRMHWVACEAVAAAVTLGREYMREGQSENVDVVSDHFATWVAWMDQYLREAPGRWIHEVDEGGQASSTTWAGKPDAYHVAQMLLMPLLPSAASFAEAVRRYVQS
ncbi:AGE family epimerase/isomerase [Schaalia suimastitidis]|uniref:AGE family epimerase/isomerase n=1 Tax=Schaalia suimastitidis TaxID=121163 RepID=UPI0005502DD8|nr:AGE family epimerase/isomerase [Schaalia suimastitidis]